MADNSSMSSYKRSGFAQASGVSELQKELSNYDTDDTSLRQQAVQQYTPTYEAEQKSLQDQLSALIKAQTDDSDLLNSQYQQSMNTMMSKLSKRGLNHGGLPQAQTAALNRFRNEVMEQRQSLYKVQQNSINTVLGTLKGNYEANIRKRMYDNKRNNLEKANTLLTSIAELQFSSYQDYINYLLAKKARRSSSGRRRYYSSGSSGGSGSSGSSKSFLDKTLEEYYAANSQNNSYKNLDFDYQNSYGTNRLFWK